MLVLTGKRIHFKRSAAELRVHLNSIGGRGALRNSPTAGCTSMQRASVTMHLEFHKHKDVIRCCGATDGRGLTAAQTTGELPLNRCQGARERL